MAQGRITYFAEGRFQRAPLRLVDGDFRRLDMRSSPGRRLESVIVERVVPELLGKAGGKHGRASGEHRGRQPSRTDLDVYRLGEFVERLLKEDATGCEAMVKVAARHSGNPQDVAALLLEPAARVIGKRWEDDTADFMRVTVALARIQRMFYQIAAEIPPTAGVDPEKSILLARTPGDQHAFGLTVVEDAFRRAGWLVDSPEDARIADLVRLVQRNNYAVIGVSVNGEALLGAFSSTIRKLKVKSRNKSSVIIAGGSILVDRPSVALDAGADFVARDAESAVQLAETVIASKVARPHMPSAAE